MLTKKQLNDIHSLQQICEETGNIKLKLNWDTLKSRADEENDYFHYDNSGNLLGYLALYNFGGPVELCGMVHPNHRRKGIFSSLFNEAVKQLAQARKLLINAPASSQSAEGYIKSLPCTYSFSEYQMKRHKTKKIGTANSEVTMRQAVSSDLAFINHLDTACFDIPKDEAEVFNKKSLPAKMRGLLSLNTKAKKPAKSEFKQKKMLRGFTALLSILLFRGKESAGALLQMLLICSTARELAGCI